MVKSPQVNIYLVPDLVGWWSLWILFFENHLIFWCLHAQCIHRRRKYISCLSQRWLRYSDGHGAPFKEVTAFQDTSAKLLCQWPHHITVIRYNMWHFIFISTACCQRYRFITCLLPLWLFQSSLLQRRFQTYSSRWTINLTECRVLELLRWHHDLHSKSDWMVLFLLGHPTRKSWQHELYNKPTAKKLCDVTSPFTNCWHAETRFLRSRSQK